jgi:hypothetical protein
MIEDGGGTWHGMSSDPAQQAPFYENKLLGAYLYLFYISKTDASHKLYYAHLGSRTIIKASLKHRY